MSSLGWLLIALGLALAGPVRHSRHRAARGRGQSARPPLPVLAGFSIAIAVGLLAGRYGLLLALPSGLLASWLTRRLASSTPPGQPDRRSTAFVVDLFASALAAGAPPESAIAGVAEAVAHCAAPGLQTAVAPLRRVGRLLQLGTEPGQAWSSLDAIDSYQPVAVAGRRCAHSGARLAETLRVTANELRTQHQDLAVARAERIGVWALLPLGCCFLPAFVCIGVVPVVVGVAGQVLHR